MLSQYHYKVRNISLVGYTFINIFSATKLLYDFFRHLELIVNIPSPEGFLLPKFIKLRKYP